MQAAATLLCIPLNTRTSLSFHSKFKDASFRNVKKLSAVVSDKVVVKDKNRLWLNCRRLYLCNGVRRNSNSTSTSNEGGGSGMELDDNFRKFIQIVLWIAEAVYVLWLFLLPYAPVRFHFYEILNFFFFYKISMVLI